MSKLLVYIVGFVCLAIGIVVGGFGGSQIATRAIKASIVPCPDCKCPPSTVVDLGKLDFDKINNKRGNMQIEQTFENVTILLTDSAMYKRAIQTCK